MDEERVLRVPEGTIEIPAEAYAESDFTTVILPEEVRRIGEAAFLGCMSLLRVHLPKSLHEIADGAFTSCSALREITFPEGLRRIGEMAFFESGLRAVSVPASVNEIGEMAFWGCEDLRFVEVLGKETLLYKDAFGGAACISDGYFAPGFPKEETPWSMKGYALLWAANLERYDDEATVRGFSYVRTHLHEWLETIIATGRGDALRKVAEACPEDLKGQLAEEAAFYLKEDPGLERNRELRAVFLTVSLKQSKNKDDDEFLL